MDGPAGRSFRAFVSYRDQRALREASLKEMAPRIMAMALADDQVVPYYEVINTLQGANRDIGIPVSVYSPPYPYRHEDPFPVLAKEGPAVDAFFAQILEKGAAFLA
jgi:hypothetical protein